MNIDNLFPLIKPEPLIIKQITIGEAKELIKKYHYLGSKPFRCSYAFGLFLNGNFSGAIVFHGISAPETMVGAFGLPRNQQQGFWEIGRLVLLPTENGKNYGSKLISIGIKLLQKETLVRAVVSYADSTYHNGAVYQASNFTYCGLTSPKADFYVNGKIKERGKTKGVIGEWKPRPRKHRYIRILDKSLNLKWPVMPYPKRDK